MTIDSIAGPRRVARTTEARLFACFYVIATCLLAAGCATAPARRSAQGPELRRIEEQWDEETGARFFVPTPPTTGPLRNSYTPRVGRTYFMLFGNPGRFIKPGRKVTVQIGEFRALNFVVQ